MYYLFVGLKAKKTCHNFYASPQAACSEKNFSFKEQNGYVLPICKCFLL